MKKEEFERRLIELVEEYIKSNISNVALQNLSISVGKDKLPELNLNGVLIEKGD